MTHRAAATYDSLIPRRPRFVLLALAFLPLAACGGQESTLPPSPGANGAIALRYLAHDPEVYADATITTVGRVARVSTRGAPLYDLLGGHGARIVLEPTASVARYDGDSVRVAGTFTVTFELGYEILVSRVTRGDTL